MVQRVAARRLVPAALAVAGVAAAAVLLTRDLGPGSSAAMRAPAVPDAQELAVGPLDDLLPTDAEWGTGWRQDDAAASQQITDGPGLVHPCGVEYPSDGERTELVRRNVLQDDREVPVGSAMTYELARYAPGGAGRALAERVAALRDCTGWRRTFAGLPDTPVELGLLAPPAGGDGAAAHLAVTADGSQGLQAIEYTFLVARQGDVLVSAVVGNGNGSGSDLDDFARGYFATARSKVAGRPHPSPEQVGSS